MVPPDALSDNFVFLDANRIKTLHEIACESLPYDPHDYSLEAVSHLVDGDNVLVWSGCGSGKTGIIALLAVILAQLGIESSFGVPCETGSEKFVLNPAILVICLTNELEVDIEGKLCKLNVKAVAINANLLKNSADNLWARAESEAMVILMSPEQLQGDDFRKHLLNSKIFASHIDTLVVDEAHLVYQWSLNFWMAYNKIGTMRNCLKGHNTRLLLLPLFELIHRSNLRPEIWVTTLTLKASIANALCFPEFRWVVSLSRVTIIFVRDHSLALHIGLYLMHCDPDLALRVHKCDASNNEEYDKKTRAMVNNLEPSGLGLILVSTDVLMVGVQLWTIKGH
ncbi:P-loop containing nucleoside triphosphate hydrolase protein [Mycena floridula]|nr:P-loop containing nucleoside triphosphate hydrolase protein [Mycena floridula]